ncbi:hypothetical protein OHB37_25715 [Streptomyces albidoflavus]|uniref:hypothetical protein n=1 Tax=Streptomyces TaxID=1883 RepID=UPI001BE60D35|nr:MULTISPECIES: hypothetical protein [unclassified Streptomyces]MBT2877298.1 hypothetical protein [Streptomyces sp. McG6]MBT2885307.1 hypothetical protein [Streptomyces sp. McG5]MBT2890814.1 hypothetical protein [Streptomyces sp. McG2]WSB17346.1 hypothetical protein OHB37_25715 [Streptomyces albidoflavus]
MERLELIVVQLEEAKGMIEKGRVPNLRLAYLLIDSVTELILHRTVQTELQHQGMLKELLLVYQQTESYGMPVDAEEVASIEAKIVSKSDLKDIDRNFDAKVGLLVRRNLLDKALGPVLEKLHKYRNEMYHRDKLRPEIIRPATLIYFDSACTVLESYRQMVITYPSDLGAEICRFTGGRRPGFGETTDLPKKIAAQLRREVGLDISLVRSALAAYLDARLDQMVDGLEFIEDNLGGPPLVRGDALRLVQANLAANPTLEQVRGRKYQYSKADLEQWRTRIAALESITDKHALVSEYAAIEDSFEPLEEKIKDAVLQVDYEVQSQIDFARGK